MTMTKRIFNPLQTCMYGKMYRKNLVMMCTLISHIKPSAYCFASIRHCGHLTFPTYLLVVCQISPGICHFNCLALCYYSPCRESWTKTVHRNFMVEILVHIVRLKGVVKQLEGRTLVNHDLHFYVKVCTLVCSIKNTSLIHALVYKRIQGRLQCRTERRRQFSMTVRLDTQVQACPQAYRQGELTAVITAVSKVGKDVRASQEVVEPVNDLVSFAMNAYMRACTGRGTGFEVIPLERFHWKFQMTKCFCTHVCTTVSCTTAADMHST